MIIHQNDENKWKLGFLWNFIYFVLNVKIDFSWKESVPLERELSDLYVKKNIKFFYQGLFWYLSFNLNLDFSTK